MMMTREHRSPEMRPKHYRLLRRRLPWYIQLLVLVSWLSFLAFVVYYLFPALQNQLIP